MSKLGCYSIEVYPKKLIEINEVFNAFYQEKCTFRYVLGVKVAHYWEKEMVFGQKLLKAQIKTNLY